MRVAFFVLVWFYSCEFESAIRLAAIMDMLSAHLRRRESDRMRYLLCEWLVVIFDDAYLGGFTLRVLGGLCNAEADSRSQRFWRGEFYNCLMSLSEGFLTALFAYISVFYYCQ